jgi:hypothetical protein
MLAVTLLMPLVAAAQDVTVPALKAAFIYNFVKFTEWPVVPPVPGPFVLCVVRDAAVGDALEREVRGREFSGRRITVLSVAAGTTESCRLLYVSGATIDDVARAIAGLQDTPVLTISDVAGFTNTGGMVQLLFERGQLRFTIKADAVKRSGLRMSATLLALGQR